MTHKLHKGRLRQKGWSEEEIAHAEAVFSRAEQGKHPAIARLDQLVYWLLLVLITLGVAVVAVELLPALLLLPAAMTCVLLLILAICLGTLFTIVIQDIHWLEQQHHGIALALLVIVSFAAFLLVRMFSDRFVSAELAENPWLLGLFFAVGLVAPYVFHLLTEHRARR